MASVTYDGRSFMLDGRRIWLVSGSVHYARVPRDQWAQRIHAARAAGLNTIETPVFWNRHEPRPGQFDFKGDNDLRYFIQLIGQAGMWCILRPGPFVGAEWDFGGLPSWLLSAKGVKLRVANGPFLEACSRYLTAVADQVRDLQVTSPGKSGPLLLIQNESSWTCGDDHQADAYLGELNRYLRESGLEVPTINANNLWQGVEGEIDCWSGSGDMLGVVRQLAMVRPEQPRLVVEFDAGATATWGSPAQPPASPGTLEQRLAQILAAGGQFNIYPFHGGTNFGFWGGRLLDAADGFVTASHDCGAPLTETGAPAASYQAVRRVCTFASRFGRVLSNLDPLYRPVAISPGTLEAAAEPSRARGKRTDAPRGPTVVHTSGAQGGVAFIFNPAHDAERPSPEIVRLLLPDGTTLPVDISGQPVTWCLFDVFIGGRAKLDYSNLSAFGMVGKVIVLFGPPGAEGQTSINGSPLNVAVPARGRPASIHEHEGVTLVLCTQEHLDTTFLTDDAVFLNVSDVTTAGQPVGLPGAKNCTRINADGKSSVAPVAAPPAPKRASDRLSLSEWSVASMHDYCDGGSPRFASIDGPGDLGSLGSPFGYGWYRVRIKSGAAGKVRLAFPHGADRLHVYLDGERAGVVGRGPGAQGELSVVLKKGAHTLVVLAENLGRLAGGNNIGEAKGLFGPFYEIKPIRVPKPVLKVSEPLPILSFRTPIWEVNPGDLALPERITWTLAHRRKTPVIFTIGPSAARGLLLLNGKTFAILERGSAESYVLQPDQLKAGMNLIQMAAIADAQCPSAKELLDSLHENASFDECVQDLTARADWGFAKWEPPRASAYHKPKSTPARGCPAWWSATFPSVEAGRNLFFDATGLTKGQLYINGRHLGRYFVATPEGKPVPPQTHYYIPSPWLNHEGDNQVLVFDEHGAAPTRCRLVPEGSKE